MELLIIFLIFVFFAFIYLVLTQFKHLDLIIRTFHENYTQNTKDIKEDLEEIRSIVDHEHNILKDKRKDKQEEELQKKLKEDLNG